MQTFLPYADFAASAAALDMKRLGKQRVETLQIMKALADPTYGWRNHSAVRMWRGHGAALLDYQRAICNEWTGRGYRDTCLDKTRTVFESNIELAGLTTPPWLVDEDLHLSHRSNLIRKFPEHYAPLFPDTPHDLEYVWPVTNLLAA